MEIKENFPGILLFLDLPVSGHSHFKIRDLPPNMCSWSQSGTTVPVCYSEVWEKENICAAGRRIPNSEYSGREKEKKQRNDPGKFCPIIVRQGGEYYTLSSGQRKGKRLDPGNFFKNNCATGMRKVRIPKAEWRPEKKMWKTKIMTQEDLLK